MKDIENNPTTKNPIVTLAIEDIVMVEELQVRKKMDNKTINAYMTVLKDGGIMPIPKAAKINDGYLLIDGWHRVTAMRRLDYLQVDVEIVAWSMEDAMAYASTANSAHGLRIKKSEFRKALWLFMKGNRHIKGKHGAIKSLRDIRDELKADVSHTTIRNWLMKDHPKVFKALCKQHDGESSFTKYEGNRNHTVHIFNEGIMTSVDRIRALGRTVDDQHQLNHIADELARLADEFRQGKISMKPVYNDDF